MIKIQNLEVIYSNGFKIKPINLHIKRGEIISLIGESGSGKSTVGKAITRTLCPNSIVKGSIYVQDEDIYEMNSSELMKLRRYKMTMCFQNSHDVLNPRITIKKHILEIFDGSIEDIQSWFDKLELDRDVLNRYPIEISGGERQKVLIILALINEPDIVILDEPTSSLDNNSKKLVCDLIKEINSHAKTSFLIITHDLSLVRNFDSLSMVMYYGHILEIANSEELLKEPRHPWSRGLINSSMDINPYKDIWGVKQGPINKEGCPFYYRCTQKLKDCKNFQYNLEKIDTNRYISCNRKGIIKLIEVKNLGKKYGSRIIFKNINLDLYSGEIVSIIGPSGVGKTTLLEIIGGFRSYDYGQTNIISENVNMNNMYQLQNGLQFIFQDPKSALNLNFTVFDSIAEPLKIQSYPLDEIKARVIDKMERVGLETNTSFLNAPIYSISDGEKQRVLMARALVMNPQILLADEPISMLDPSNKASLLNFLKDIQNKEGFSMIMITHDLKAAIKISDRIYYMNKNIFKEYRGFEIEKLKNLNYR